MTLEIILAAEVVILLLYSICVTAYCRRTIPKLEKRLHLANTRLALFEAENADQWWAQNSRG